MYLATIEVDGQPLVNQVLDENEGRCRKPFSYLVPCKKTAAGTVSLDTARLSDGAHSVRLLVSDASETNQIAYGPVQITTRNLVRGALNGTNASDRANLTARFAGRKGRSLTSRLGRKVRIVGRLTDENGRAISGATVRILGRDHAATAPLTLNVRASGSLRARPRVVRAVRV